MFLYKTINNKTK